MTEGRLLFGRSAAPAVQAGKRREGKKFSYRDIKKVYTIVFYEKSTKEFHEFEDIYIHHSQQETDTGLKIGLLQEYDFIALDIFRKKLQNNLTFAGKISKKCPLGQ